MLNKTQIQAQIRQALEGGGLTRWEAEALPCVVEAIDFRGGGSFSQWMDGQCATNLWALRLSGQIFSFFGCKRGHTFLNNGQSTKAKSELARFRHEILVRLMEEGSLKLRRNSG